MHSYRYDKPSAPSSQASERPHCKSRLRALHSGLPRLSPLGVSPMRRRDFLKRSTAAGAAALVSGATPAILTARDKSGTKNVIIGQGDYRYECIHNWGELPRHIRWETTHGVTIDEDGFIYIKHQGLHPDRAAMDTIVVFDPKGKFVRSFGKGYYPGGHGIDIRKEGGEQFLYLCDIALAH